MATTSEQNPFKGWAGYLMSLVWLMAILDHFRASIRAGTVSECLVMLVFACLLLTAYIDDPAPRAPETALPPPAQLTSPVTRD